MKNEIKNDKLVLYRSKDGSIRLEARIEKDSLWITQKQMAELFATERSVITKHLRNIFNTKELVKNSVSAKCAHTAEDNKTYQTQFYNLDAIISVGYRVNSKRGTEFRIWATKVLRDHIVKGYTKNPKRLKELKKTLKLASEITHRKDLYPSLEEKAANLLYFLVKNHSFVDGNKRIAAVIFLQFIERNDLLYREDGSQRIANNALVAITLMIAESKPKEKEVITVMITNLINKQN